MAKLRHIAITVPDPWKAAEFYMQVFGMQKVGETDRSGARGVYLSDGVINLALLRYQTEEYAGKLGRDFVGVHQYHDPDGIVFDITANGWVGAAKD